MLLPLLAQWGYTCVEHRRQDGLGALLLPSGGPKGPPWENPTSKSCPTIARMGAVPPHAQSMAVARIGSFASARCLLLPMGVGVRVRPLDTSNALEGESRGPS